jgi:hypothetical protein
VRFVHEVLRVLGARTAEGSLPGARNDGFRVALAIEGGGMRGTISAGMALALDELGLASAFDAVYGASAGATLRRESPALRATFLARDSRLAADDLLLTSHQSAFSIRPLAGSPVVSRLATDGRLLRAAFESGRAATHATFTP